MRFLQAIRQHFFPPAVDNSYEKVKFRQNLLAAEDWMVQARASVTDASIDEDFPVSHHFSPIDAEYGCCMYGRKLIIPKGSLIIGRIHKHHCMNFILKGKVVVTGEGGKNYFQAPDMFISGPGTKRAIRALEDSIWVNVVMAKNSGDDLEAVEGEVFAETYREIGLISSLRELAIGR